MQFSDIKGFGVKRTEKMKEAGFSCPEDLVYFFPSDYIDVKNLSDLASVSDGERAVILGHVEKQPKPVYPRRGLSIIKAKFIYGSDVVYCSFFNQPYLANSLVPTKYYYVYGKLKRNAKSYEIVGGKLLPFTGNEPPMIPVYKQLKGVSSRLVSDAVRATLEKVSVGSFAPSAVRKELGLGDVDRAIREVHFPSSPCALTESKRLLSVEKLAYNLCTYSVVRSDEGVFRQKFYSRNDDALSDMINALPYRLTQAQQRCLDSIIARFHSDKRLNALLEGDVGSGKTIVIFLAMYYAALSGGQSVLIAPTEILARQHYAKATAFFEGIGIECAYLSSAVRTKGERERVLERINSGKAKCVIGTHSLLSDDVYFENLFFVVADEQHRFGVSQRARLENKTRGADSIVVSATPIPRTLALALYGELERLVLDEAPQSRGGVTTRFVPKEREMGMWNYVEERIALGERVFVVAPRIEEADDCPSAESIYEANKSRFGDDIALLHGKQSDKAKGEIMAKFTGGSVKVLVSTTVVEVGVDVPEATVMIIYGADRFGLSQLHQLRGRVGRGEKSAYCFVLSSVDSENARSRLDAFIGCSDGFALAERDFALRGAGDFIGQSQHGNAGSFPSDAGVIADAKRLSGEVLLRPDCVKAFREKLSDENCDYFGELTLN